MHGAIEHALRQLSIGAHYKGFRFATLAVVIILNDETCLTKVNRAIYKDIAALTGFSPTAIERYGTTISARVKRFKQKNRLAPSKLMFGEDRHMISCAGPLC